MIGSGYLSVDDFWFFKLLDALIVFSGIIILILGIKRMMRSIISAFVTPSEEGELMDIIFQRRQLGKGPRVVAIGGGTGLAALLSGLKDYTSNITAIVTVADDGGSSGRLRQQFDILPPGDIRNCLVALADAPALMRDLFQFRFDRGPELAGHSFGNLFITAMTRVTGDFEKAIKETSRVLALRGQVLPSTLSNVVLVAQHKDGSITEGEDKIPRTRVPIQRVSFRSLAPVSATPEAIKAIQQAQIIVLGPGSLYTSIIPNLLIKEITETIVSSQALKIYVCNIMTQPGETDNFTAADHIKTLVAHSHPRIFDFCMVNSGPIPEPALSRYAQEGSRPVALDLKEIRLMGYRVISESCVTVEDGVIRHDSSKLAKIIIQLEESI